jgi:copper homeostasis protein
MRVAVEVCVSSLEEARAAANCGVESVEACTWLACGGITPSGGLVQGIRTIEQVVTRVLIRSTPGGFRYSDDDRAIMLTDARDLALHRVGLVVGALNERGLPDEDFVSALRERVGEAELTFHRAIDHAADALRALDSCRELRIQRVLTSGGRTLAMEGAPMLKRMVDQAGGRIRIAAAGGINPANVVELVERTGVNEVHFAAQRPVNVKAVGASMSSANVGVNFEVEPDLRKIEGVLNALVKAGLR